MLTTARTGAVIPYLVNAIIPSPLNQATAARSLTLLLPAPSDSDSPDEDDNEAEEDDSEEEDEEEEEEEEDSEQEDDEMGDEEAADDEDSDFMFNMKDEVRRRVVQYRRGCRFLCVFF